MRVFVLTYMNTHLHTLTMKPRFTNKFSEQKKKISRVMNDVSSDKHTNRQQRGATSLEYQWKRTHCGVDFTPYIS